MEPGKLAIRGYPLPVRRKADAHLARRSAAALRLTVCAALLAVGCGGSDDRPRDVPAADPAATSGAPTTVGDARSVAATAELELLREGGFRPVAFQDTATLWGVLRGRLARLDLPTGRVEAQPHAAWSLAAGPGVVSWRNETGTWGEREGDSPRRLAPTELMPGYEGPPDVLWSPDGRRAILTWTAEWDGHHELLDADGSRTSLATFEDGYNLDFPALWLDDERVLFTLVATGPRGGEPEYREAGWRGDLAVLDLERDEFRRVTDAPDSTWLRPAGLLDGRLLVRADGPGRLGEFWLYDPHDWSREPAALPPGRARAAGDAVVLLEPAPAAGDAWDARLYQNGRSTELGPAADPDLDPAVSRDGRRIALRVLRDGRPALLLIRR